MEIREYSAQEKFFYDLGCYEEIPLMEDVSFMQKCKKDKTKPLPVKDACKKPRPDGGKKEGFLYTTLRNWTIISLYHLGIKPSLLKKIL